ncbi:hypothetical protein [Alloscardovia theropitheci]|uniref:hypothetical protein n=1 Tax=Alloscardovia theropitheci TaxID=2496842 RepID=UPI0013F151CA|nr:hypothetical protein [Alloscardovia theropitheci]
MTARMLISVVDYVLAERVFEGNKWRMAVELDVTLQVLEDFQGLLVNGGVCVES